MDEMGLAAQAGQPGRPQGPMDMEQIIAMIMQGMSPEDLIAQGVPEELVMQAVQIISEEATEVPEGQSGLAASMVRPEPRM